MWNFHWTRQKHTNMMTSQMFAIYTFWVVKKYIYKNAKTKIACFVWSKKKKKKDLTAELKKKSVILIGQ